MSSSKFRTIFKSLSTQAAARSNRLSVESIAQFDKELISAAPKAASVNIQRRMKSEQLQNITPNKVEGVVLDWSGTTLDRYVIAPAVVFVEVFKEFGVDISMKEARVPMGLRKDLHIEQLTKMDSVKEKWKAVHGNYPDQLDVDNMFEKFVPMQLACLKDYSELLPGVADITQGMQKDGLLIGLSTGFTRSMVDILLCHAKEQGFTPDATVAGDEVVNGARPAPHMVFKNMDLLGLANPKAVVKVDDTVTGVGEGLNAGCWSVGVSKWSNYVDVDSFEHEKQLSADELEERRIISRETLLKSGAHYVIDDINLLPGVISDVNRRLANGETPADDFASLKSATLAPFKEAKEAKEASEDSRSLTGYPTW